MIFDKIGVDINLIKQAKYIKIILFTLILFFIQFGIVYQSEASPTWNNDGIEYFEVTSDSAIIYDIRSGSYERVGKLSNGQVFPRVGQSGNYHKIIYGNYYAYVHKSHTKWHSGVGINNTVKEIKESEDFFTANNTVRVIDNSTGKFV